MRLLVTGAAGFIGAHVMRALRARGHEVAGIDNFNDYYTPVLKRDRVAALCGESPGSIHEIDIADAGALAAVFEAVRPERVVHLAAQAGVRYSLTHPQAYAHSNLTGFLNILEACRHQRVEHLVFASSSSVYGANATAPFSENQRVDRPLSFYAATKAANELMAHSYAHLYGIPMTGLRFFTVYGRWGRPDMAPILFARAILAGRPIEVFNHGRMRRDFTHIDDIVDGVIGALDCVPVARDGQAAWQVFNLGNHRPIELGRFIEIIEQAAGRPAQRVMRPMQPGDMLETCADVSAAAQAFGFNPATRIESGLPQLVEWCRDYFGEAV